MRRFLLVHWILFILTNQTISQLNVWFEGSPEVPIQLNQFSAIGYHKYSNSISIVGGKLAGRPTVRLYHTVTF